MQYRGVIDDACDGARLLQAVTQATGLSRKEAKLAIASGRVRLGRSVCRIIAKPVRTGQALTVSPALAADKAPAAAASARDEAAPHLPILHIDRHVVAVNKPAGLLSEHDRFGAPSVERLLPALLRARGEPDAVWLVHRLDAGTSGVLLLARTKAAARRLFEAFRLRRTRKSYFALVQHGALQAPCAPLAAREAFAATGRARVDAALMRDVGTKQKVAEGPHPQAKPAQTHIDTECAAGAAAWLAVRPITGRTHQIRVHLAWLGAPIVGDGLYGGARYVAQGASPALPVRRPMLHAHTLEVPCPSRDAAAHGAPAPMLRICAPVPADFSRVAVALGIAPRVKAAPCPTRTRNAAPPKK